MVSDAAATKAPIAKIADRVSGVFVPTVDYDCSDHNYCMADRRTEYWFCIIQRDCGAGDQLSVCARTCNTGSNYGRKWNGSQKWYYVQDSSFTGRDWKDAIVALDKTGTITSGEPKVTDIIPAAGVTEDTLLKYSVCIGE